MKKILLTSTILVAALTFQSCQTADKKSSTTKDSVAGDTMMVNGNNHESRDDTPETGLDEAGATFLKKAAVGGMMEVEAAKIAIKNAGNQSVKDFASQMLADHTKANEEVKAFAADNRIIIPDALPADKQIQLDEMKKLKGAAFDKKYMGMMVTDHDKTVALFKDGTENRHSKLKIWATKTLAIIEHHAQMAKEINTSL